MEVEEATGVVICGIGLLGWPSSTSFSLKFDRRDEGEEGGGCGGQKRQQKCVGRVIFGGGSRVWWCFGLRWLMLLVLSSLLGRFL